MNIRLLTSQQNLVEELTRELHTGAKDLSSYLVIFPEIRPSYYLRKYLAEQLKGSFIPPQACSMDTFLNQLYERGLGKNDRMLDSMDAMALLYEIHRMSPSPLGQKHF